MGYYTQYDIEKVIGAEQEEIEEWLKLEYGYSEAFETPHKWYDHDSYFKRASLKFEGCVIILNGVGEENPDIWRKWYHNGNMKMARANITFDEPENYDNKEIRRF